MAPKSENTKSGKRRSLEKGSDEYLKKRERNNVAVKKSRDKARQKNSETHLVVNQLRSENAELERKVKLLTKELEVLKDLFLCHAARDAPETPPPQTVIVPIKYEVDAATGQCFVSGGSPKSSALIDHEYCS